MSVPYPLDLNLRLNNGETIILLAINAAARMSRIPLHPVCLKLED